MYKKIKMKWVAVLLCMSISMPVYAAETDPVPVTGSGISVEDSQSVMANESADETIIEKESAGETVAEDFAGEDAAFPVGGLTEETADELAEAGLGTLPSKFDPREDPWYLTPIRDQGHYGSCWAHGLLFTAEAYLLKNHLVPQYNNKTLNLSERVLNHIAYNQDKYPDS